MKSKIYIKDWLLFKPYSKHTEVDMYYLNVCNDLHKEFKQNIFYRKLKNYLSKNDIKNLCVILVCYFEDIICEIGIWRAFLILHQKKFGKPLPYYDLTNYQLEETSIQDINFLIWNFINHVDDDIILRPNDFLVTAFSEDVMKVLDDEWEYAPENDKLKAYFQLNDYEGEDEFYKARGFIEKIMLDGWLLSLDFLVELSKAIDMIEESPENELFEKYAYLYKDNIVLNSKSKLLNSHGKDWAATVLGENHQLYCDISNLTPKVHGIFKLIDKSDKYYRVEHIASEIDFNLLKSSLNMVEEFKDDKLYYLGIVKWKGEWLFSGVLYQLNFDLDIIKSEKNNQSRKESADFLKPDEHQIIKEVLNNQLKAFKSVTGGSLVKILTTSEIDSFYNKFHEAYLKIKGHKPEKGFSLSESIFDDFKRKHEIALVFFNTNSGVEFYFNIESAFPYKDNEYFEERNAYDKLDVIFMSDIVSPELAKYYFSEFKNHKKFKDYFENNPLYKDLDFTLMYYKKNNYDSKPRIKLKNKI